MVTFHCMIAIVESMHLRMSTVLQCYKLTTTGILPCNLYCTVLEPSKSYSSHRTSLQIPSARVVLQVQILEAKYEVKPSVGGRGGGGIFSGSSPYASF